MNSLSNFSLKIFEEYETLLLLSISFTLDVRSLENFISLPSNYEQGQYVHLC